MQGGSNISKIAATSLLMGVTRASSEAYIIASALRTVWSALFLLALSRAITPNINEQNEMNTTIITLFLVIIYKLTTKYCKLLTINLFCDK